MKRLEKLHEEYINITFPDDLDSLVIQTSKTAKKQRHFLLNIHYLGVFTLILIALFSIVMHTWKLIT